MFVNAHIMSQHNGVHAHTSRFIERDSKHISARGKADEVLSVLLSYTVYIDTSYFVNINARLTQELYGSYVFCNLCSNASSCLKVAPELQVLLPSSGMTHWEMPGDARHSFFGVQDKFTGAEQEERVY